MGPLAIGLLGGVGSAAAYPIIERLLSGSPEDQMRKQLEIQDEFEQQRAARMGGGEMGDLDGLVGGRRPSLAELAGEYELTEMAARDARGLDRLRNARRPAYMDELDQIVAGNTARIAQLQSERVLTPMEIIQMIEGGYG
jgi:hypothetical protein